MLAAIETNIWHGATREPLTLLYREDAGAGTQCPQELRGECATLLKLIGKYGIVGYDAMRKVDTPAPKWVFMLGATYTPQEFARSVCKPGEYLQLMSNSRKPYYQEMELEVEDNWLHDRYLNIPTGLAGFLKPNMPRQHHGVCWEDANHGMAIVGIAHDDQGEKYFIMKKHLGHQWPLQGAGIPLV